MGHNLCLDIFGGPSAEEAAAGLGVHGEASVEPYDLETSGTTLVARAHLPIAGLQVERRIELVDRAARISEVVENLTSTDRPIGWTQHVTLGPPFLRKGVTEFRASATRSKVFEARFGSADYLASWRRVRLADGAARRRRRGRSASLHERARVERLHGAPHGPPP